MAARMLFCLPEGHAGPEETMRRRFEYGIKAPCAARNIRLRRVLMRDR